MQKPPPQSIQNYNRVWAHYECTDDEIRYEKKRIMANFYEADKCYSIIASGILEQ